MRGIEEIRRLGFEPVYDDIGVRAAALRGGIAEVRAAAIRRGAGAIRRLPG